MYGWPDMLTIYYGDEIGMEGSADPYCRAFFEWENAQGELHDYYRTLGRMRKEYRQEFKSDFEWLGIRDGVASFMRGEHIQVVLNFSDKALTPKGKCLVKSCDGELLLPANGGVYLL